jgi:hypothetical protein
VACPDCGALVVCLPRYDTIGITNAPHCGQATFNGSQSNGPAGLAANAKFLSPQYAEIGSQYPPNVNGAILRTSLEAH